MVAAKTEALTAWNWKTARGLVVDLAGGHHPQPAPLAMLLPAGLVGVLDRRLPHRLDRFGSSDHAEHWRSGRGRANAHRQCCTERALGNGYGTPRSCGSAALLGERGSIRTIRNPDRFQGIEDVLAAALPDLARRFPVKAVA